MPKYLVRRTYEEVYSRIIEAPTKDRALDVFNCELGIDDMDIDYEGWKDDEEAKELPNNHQYDDVFNAYEREV